MLPSLAGLTVAVTADRRADEQTELFRRRGAEVVLAPLAHTRALTDGTELEAATEAVIERPPDTMIAITGLGIRSWFATADGRGRGDALRSTLGRARILARGPKAAGALTTVGLEPTWVAPAATSDEIATHLGHDLARHRVAIVHDGGAVTGLPVTLRRRGADLVDVTAYRSEPPRDRALAEGLVTGITAGRLDAVTFTSSVAVTSLFTIAAELGGAAAVDAVRRGLRGPVLPVCVGPVSAARLAAQGVDRPAHPARGSLGAMVHHLDRAMATRRRTFALAGTGAVVQGTALAIAGAPMTLSRREAQLLTALVDAGGAVVTKERLAEAVWSPGADPHLVEVTVARLRRRLGPSGDAVRTVPRRGYRLTG